jgi:hypothetical protein
MKKQVFQNHRKLKLVLLIAAVMLPTFFSIICVRLNFTPSNSVDSMIFGTSLLPDKLTTTPVIQLFEITLICAMVIITAILAGIALSKRMTNK